MTAPEERAARLIKTILDPNKFGGMVPLPTVSRDDPEFVDDGGYWRGSVWLPTTYMTVKALEKYGEFDLASEVAYRTIKHMADVYENYLPHTIWECYSPTAALPAKNGRNRVVRKDFCGWSALGPISLFIENVLGFHRADAVEKVLEFHPRQSSGKYGVKNFKFGDVCCDIIVENGTLNCRSNTGFTLIIDGCRHGICAGEQTIRFSR